MFEVMFIGAVALIVLAIVGVTAAWLLARLMDRANSRASGQWKHVLTKIESDSLSCSIYYGARWLGICVLLGWLFSRSV